ncbi:unnamed protein product [Brachionus calyciflorus]|uniref:Peptidase S1 domain-containing protein n=1 Tax=Brachionus calyciflorus TaxID=104777 RepID=A0A814MHV5_9BILA|nr:unnamed protein product [Brachionus calyciflorus]
MHFCGGSLIYSETVLTAAHCVYGLKSSDLAVAVGIYHLNWNLNESNIFYVSKIIIHEKYSKYSVNNDIAILKLIQSVNISSTVSTICLPIHKKELKNSYYKNLITSGWGSTDGENSPLSLSEDLKQTLLTIHDDKYCLKNFPFFEIKTMYCGSFKNSSLYSNICYGDSGGPLFYSENNKWILYGITSLLMTINETLICDPSKPSFFSSVSGFLDWIANNLV